MILVVNPFPRRNNTVYNHRELSSPIIVNGTETTSNTFTFSKVGLTTPGANLRSYHIGCVWRSESECYSIHLKAEKSRSSVKSPRASFNTD